MEITTYFSWDYNSIGQAQLNISTFSLTFACPFNPLVATHRSLTFWATNFQNKSPFIALQHFSSLGGWHWSRWSTAAGIKHFSWPVQHAIASLATLVSIAFLETVGIGTQNEGAYASEFYTFKFVKKTEWICIFVKLDPNFSNLISL